MNLCDMTIPSQAGVTPDSALADVIAPRREIVEMTEIAEDAVLRPKEPGAFAHDLRAAIAARIAHAAGDGMLAAHYAADAGQYAPLADSGVPVAGDEKLSAVLAFVDKVANRTNEATADDVSELQATGLADADIVRLSELVAFMAFQVRVIAGLRLMRKETA